MHAFVEVLCAGNADSGSSVHLFVDGVRLQFGCGDGAQRTAVECGVRPSKLATIFLGSLHPVDMGGLPGMLLTASDAGLTEIVVAGPPGLEALLEAARPFFHRPSLNVMMREVSREGVVYEGTSVVVRAVPLGRDAVAYVARFRDMKGKFELARALELGVPRGKMFGMLQKGKTVVLDNGVEVTSEQVMTPSTPGPVVVFVPELREEGDAFVSIGDEKALSANALKVGDEGRISLVVHFSDNKVLAHRCYKDWIGTLSDSTRHIAIHSDFAPQRAVFLGNAAVTTMLHGTVDAEFFPLPVHSTRVLPTDVTNDNKGVEVPPTPSTYPSVVSSLSDNWIRPDIRMRFNLAPRNIAGQLDTTHVPDARYPRALNTKAARVSEGESSWWFSKPKAAKPPGDLSLEESKSTISFLGTGAAIPQKYRNVSSYYLDVGERYGVLMDCGEGTYGQLWRLFGAEGTRKALGQLRVLFISHMHADHHLGALRLLAERARIGGNIGRIAVVAPAEFGSWMNTALNASALNTIQLFDSSQLTDPQMGAAQFFGDSLGIDLGTVRVPHCPDAFALVLSDRVERWKVVFSGDCRPCDALVDAGAGATVLIHEATFEDRLVNEAQEKMHSTLGEAISVAERMGAWRTVLTHFSQRYPKVPALSESILRRCEAAGVTVASDLMVVPFPRLCDLPLVTPKISNAFQQEIEELLAAQPAAEDEKATTSVT